MLFTCRILSFLSLICLVNSTSIAQNAPYKGGSGQFKKLVWSDEFNYNGLPDGRKWNYEKGYVRNNELQYYTVQRKENAVAQNGYLTITAKNDSLKVADTICPITSASITTLGIKDFTYGRYEVRAKIPSSLGTWPAVWMLGSNIKTVGWPACGEIDILEHVGYMPDTVHFNVHTGKYNHINKNNKGVKVAYSQPYNDFHVYAIEWFKDRIDWYMDDKKVFTYNKEGDEVGEWPFNEPQYLILNLAFGGGWGGTKGVDTSSLPQSLQVDYVRIFQ